MRRDARCEDGTALAKKHLPIVGPCRPGLSGTRGISLPWYGVECLPAAFALALQLREGRPQHQGLSNALENGALLLDVLLDAGLVETRILGGRREAHLAKHGVNQ